MELNHQNIICNPMQFHFKSKLSVGLIKLEVITRFCKFSGYLAGLPIEVEGFINPPGQKFRLRCQLHLHPLAN